MVEILLQVVVRERRNLSYSNRIPNVPRFELSFSIAEHHACGLATRQTTAFATIQRQCAAFSARKQCARQTMHCCWSKRIGSFGKQRHRLNFTFSSCRAVASIYLAADCKN